MYFVDSALHIIVGDVLTLHECIFNKQCLLKKNSYMVKIDTNLFIL